MKSFKYTNIFIFFFYFPGVINYNLAQSLSEKIPEKKLSADLMIFCPENKTETSCQTQSAIATKFSNWLSSASYSGGCDVMLSNNGGVAPSACGGLSKLTFTAVSTCDPTVSCSASFAVTAAPAITLTCPSNKIEGAGQTQDQIDAKFSQWINSAGFTGGCKPKFSNNNDGAPPNTGGSTTVMWTVTSSCQAPTTCTAFFSVKEATANNEEKTFTQANISYDPILRQAILDISLNQHFICHLRLLNANAQTLWQHSIRTRQEQLAIECRDYRPGKYFVELSTAQWRKVLPFLIP